MKELQRERRSPFQRAPQFRQISGNLGIPWSQLLFPQNGDGRESVGKATPNRHQIVLIVRRLRPKNVFKATLMRP